ncbi:hypothetical protein N9043_00280 [bacterium]|nr:hypothetical protein [bacterium]
MKVKTLATTLAVVTALTLTGCVSQQMTSDTDIGFPIPDVSIDTGLDSLYSVLISRGMDAQIVSIEELQSAERGYFKFNEGNDVRYDEVVIYENEVERFRNGVSETIPIESFMGKISGGSFIRVNDPR